MLHDNILVDLGLSKEQSQVYEVLLEFGYLPARVIANKVNLSRPLVYKILDQLIINGLVRKDESKTKVAVFYPEHPNNLKNLIEIKEKEIEKIKESFEMMYSRLLSEYNFYVGKPNVLFYEGKKGVTRVHDEIIEENKDILLIRSIFDRPTELEGKELDKRIKEQAENGIHTRAITPVTPYLSESIKTDFEKLVTRRVLPKDKLSLPSQITIFGYKIAITSYKEEIFTTIIESKELSKSYREQFNLIWDISK